MAEMTLQGIWTQKGLDKETAFRAGGERKKLTHVAIGDGNGSIPIVSPAQAGLVREVWRGLVNAIMSNPDDPTDLLVDIIIPNNVGGFWIREWGIFDEDGDLVAVGPHDEMHKPLISTGQSAEFLERFHLPSANAGFVEIKIASQALATQQYVESKLDVHNRDTGAHATLARKSVRLVAGAGMAGGGTLAGDVTFAAKLTDSVTTTDSATAASATAVKTAYDAAQSKLPLDGGIMTGGIQINDPTNDVAVAPPANTERGLFLADKNGAIMGGFDVIQRASDNAKWTQIFAKNSAGQFTTLSIDIKENGEGEVNSTSPIQINDVRIGRLFANNVRLITLSGARGNEGLPLRYSPDNGELYLDGRAMHGKADTAGHADTAGTATDPTKLPLSGGTVTGVIAIKDLANVIGTAPPASTERGVFLVDKNDNIMGGFDVIQRASDNAKWAQIFAKNSKGQFTTLSIDINEDGTGEVNSTSPIQINDVRISRVFADGVRLITLSGARGNEGLPLRYSPDNGELYLDGRAMHGKADTAGYADTAQSAYGLMGMEMIIWKETFTLPGYGTWKYMYWASTEGSGGDMVIGEDPGGTVLRYPTPGKFMDGIAFRSA